MIPMTYLDIMTYGLYLPSLFIKLNIHNIY